MANGTMTTGATRSRLLEQSDNMPDYTRATLGELLTHENETIKRNAISILKQLQRANELKLHDPYCALKNGNPCNCIPAKQ